MPRRQSPPLTPGMCKNRTDVIEIAKSLATWYIRKRAPAREGLIWSPIDGMCVLQNELNNRFCGATVWTRGCGELTGGVRETLEPANGVTPRLID
jgi:hypothetical protein